MRLIAPRASPARMSRPCLSIGPIRSDNALAGGAECGAGWFVFAPLEGIAKIIGLMDSYDELVARGDPIP